MKLYDSYDPNSPSDCTPESRHAITFNFKHIRKQNRKYDVVAKDDKSSEDEDRKSPANLKGTNEIPGENPKKSKRDCKLI